MKRAFILVLAVMIVLSLAACGSRAQPDETVPAVIVDGNTVENIEENPTGQQGQQNIVITPSGVTTPFPVPSNTPAPTPTVAPTPTPATKPGTAAGGTNAAAPRDPNIVYPTATQEELDNGVDGYLNGGGVNMRSGPGTDNPVIDTLYLGDYVLILGTENGWTKVQTDSYVGYIYSNFISRGVYVPAPAPAAPPAANEGNAVIVGSDGSVIGGGTNSDGSVDAVIVFPG